MQDQDLIQFILQGGLNLVFLILYLNERTRCRDLQEKRIQEQKECSDRFINFMLGRPQAPSKTDTDPRAKKIDPP